jgi:hypothetical protein
MTIIRSTNFRSALQIIAFKLGSGISVRPVNSWTAIPLRNDFQ